LYSAIKSEDTEALCTLESRQMQGCGQILSVCMRRDACYMA